MSYKKLDLPDGRDIWINLANINVLGIRKVETLVDSKTGLVTTEGKKNKELKVQWFADVCSGMFPIGAEFKTKEEADIWLRDILKS